MLPHTPGPWTFVTKEGPRDVTFKRRHFEIGAVDTLRGVAVAFGDTDANARLIAAAPDGYVLALAIVEYFGDERIEPLLTTDILLRAMARAIVAKVEGRS